MVSAGLGWTAIGLGSALTPGAARGADALNSNNRVGAANDNRPPRTDFSAVPVAGGNTDIGFGAGYFLGLTRLEPQRQPYLWKVESAGFVTFKGEGGLSVPYGDIYAKVTAPELFGRGLRLELRPSYTSEAKLGYFGVGNDASPGAEPGPRYQFGRVHPSVDVLARVRIADHVSFTTGVRLTQNSLRVDPGSKLAEDLERETPEVKALLGPTHDHGVALFKYGLALDTRDSETSAHRGTFDELTLKLSPGGTEAFPYRYGQVTLVARFYVPIWSPKLALAVRALGDVLFGDAPFYELARYEDTYAIGGASGVRGVPAQRYAGKIKVIGNVELRSELARFRLLSKDLRAGVVAFVDGGRTWADLAPRPDLDGRALGIKAGTGLGLRLYSGETFVLRGDVAWSPHASPIAGYVMAGEMF